MYQFCEKIAYGALYGKGIIKYVVNNKYMRFLLSSLNSKTHGRLWLKLGEFLAEFQKQRIKEAIDPNKKTIVISFTCATYKDRLGNIPDKLRNRGFNVLSLVGPTPKEEYDKRKDVFWGGSYMAKKITDTFRVDAYACIAPQENMPTNTKIVMFVHDIHDSPEGKPDTTSRSYSQCDYFFLPSIYVVNRVKQQVLEGRKKFFGKKEIDKEVCLIAGGYPKLDSNLRYFKKHKQDSKTLIYAPTIMEKAYAHVGGLQRYGDKIIESILNNITDYDLIFRPHPASVPTTEVQNIIKKYRNYSRFILDDNAGSYMESYSKAALMISDFSGTAYTYAFTTLRPVVFFSPNEAILMTGLGTYQYFKDRYKVGYVAGNVEEMIEKVRLLLVTRDEFSQRIREYRDSTIYNIGKSEDYFVDNFEYILEDKKHPDWEYL